MMNQLLMSVLSQRKSEPVSSENYVRFVSASSRTITPKYTNSGVTLQYSVNNGATWTTIASGTSTTSATEHWFRGQATETKSLFTSSATTNAWAFSGSSVLEVYGNLNFLLCDALGDEVAPTSLAVYCYQYMFNGCTSLTIAPELPATSLRGYCYSDMFNGCTSITTPPNLPATTIESYCYQNMFKGCTSLTIAPELPATSLRGYCYSGMFSGCTSLTTPPILSTTSLSTACYQRMFEYCTSLTTITKLPATTMKERCYQYMFLGCTSVKVSSTKTGPYTYSWRMPTSGTGTAEYLDYWNSGMFQATGGTFKIDPTINTTYYVQNQPV